MKYEPADPNHPYWKEFNPRGKHMVLEERRGSDGGPKGTPTQEYLVVECSVSFNGDLVTPLGAFTLGGAVSQETAQGLEALGVKVTVRLSRSQTNDLALETALTLEHPWPDPH